MLVFANEESFNFYVGKLNAMSRPEVKQWSKAHGFVSQRNIYEQIADEEYAIFTTSKYFVYKT